MNLSFFENLNIMVQPILGILTLLNAFLLTKHFIEEKTIKKDKFIVKIRDSFIYFYNKGKYPISISEISIQIIEEQGCIHFVRENLIKNPIDINGFENKYIAINPIWSQLKKENEQLYLCFEIASQSGRNYDSICCQLLDKNKKLIKKSRKLKKEIFDFL